MSRFRRLLHLPLRGAALARAEMDEEIRFHIEVRAEQLTQRGWPRDEALAEAMRRFRGLNESFEEARDNLRHSAERREDRMRIRERLGAVGQDLRYAWRGLRARPGFTAAVVLTLALGIGANTAIFSVVSAVMLRPLPYRAADRVAMVWNHWESWPRTWLSQPEAYDYARADGLAGLAPFDFTALNLTGDAEPERVRAGLLSAPLLKVLGVRPLLGRGFTREEDTAGGPDAALLSWELWQRRYGGDPGILGRTIQLDARPYSVVGVLPRDFRLPLEFAGEHSTVFVPLRLGPPDENNRGSHYLYAVARLRDGVTVERAQRGMDDLIARLKREYPQAYGPEFGATLRPVEEQVWGDVRPVLLVLLGAVSFVLLIGCANVANLLLSRAEERQRELSVRAALGAGRGRIARQLFTESLLLSVLGGALGLLLAVLGVRALSSLELANLPRVDAVGIDGRVLLFTLSVIVLTGLLFGLAPVIHSRHRPLHESLRQARGGGSGPGALRVRQILVAAEIALAVLCISGAFLMTRSFASLLRVSPGFQPDHVLTLRLAPPAASYAGSSRVRAVYDRLLSEVRAIPGVKAAGATNALPLGSTIGDWGFDIEGRARREGVPQAADWQVVTPGYFEAMRIPVLRGRGFTALDRSGGRPVVVVSRATALHYWPGESPIGKRIRLGGSADSVWREVVGVVGDVKHNGLDRETRTEMYLPHSQFPATLPDSAGAAVRGMTLTLRTAGDPAALTSAVRTAVQQLDPQLPIAQVRTLDEVFRASVSTPRLAMLLLAAFGALSLLLAAIGVYGVMAYSVARRTGEMGVRLALGARPGDVVRLVVAQGMRPAVAGLALGTLAALAATRLMRGFLFGVSATDPLAFTAALAVLGLVGLAATLLPARRAARVDPMVALRVE